LDLTAIVSVSSQRKTSKTKKHNTSEDYLLFQSKTEVLLNICRKKENQPIMSRPPMFTDYSASTQQAVAQRGTPATLNLDDIFGDVMFTPDGDTVFMSEEQDALNSGEAHITTMATKIRGNMAIPSQKAGGLYTTNLYDPSKPALVMGAAAPGVQQIQSVPFKKAPQERHHLQYAVPKKKSSRSSDRKMSEQQKSERR
jgi:hypothetical protein